MLYTNKALFGELESESASNFLQLIVAVMAWIDFHSGLGSTEWNVDAGALESHQSRQGLDFIDVDFIRVSNTCKIKKIKIKVKVSFRKQQLGSTPFQTLSK